MVDLLQSETQHEKYERRYYLLIMVLGIVFFPLWHNLALHDLSKDVESVETRFVFMSPFAVTMILYFFKPFSLSVLRVLFYSMAFLLSGYYSVIVFLNKYFPDEVGLFFLVAFLINELVLDSKVKKAYLLYIFTLNFSLVLIYKAFIVQNWDMRTWEGILFFGIFTFIGFVFISNPHHEKVKSERDRANEQVNLMKKWVALGQIAGGIAHEVNSPLNSAFLKLDLLKRKMPDEPDLNNKMAELKSVLERISKIIQSLKYIALNKELDELSMVNVEKAVAEAIKICDEKFKKFEIKAIVKNELGSDFEFRLNETTIVQVLINMMNNSIDAISKLEEKWFHIRISKDDKSAFFIEITDSGKGIDASLADKLFSPFKADTTDKKFAGLGMGLGLGLCKKIIQKHGGDIILDSQSLNTRFTIRFYKQMEDIYSTVKKIS